MHNTCGFPSLTFSPKQDITFDFACLLFYRDEEHALILQYCQTLGGEGSSFSQPQSPAHILRSPVPNAHSPSYMLQSPTQILQAVEREERGELERIIARLEEEQR